LRTIKNDLSNPKYVPESILNRFVLRNLIDTQSKSFILFNNNEVFTIDMRPICMNWSIHKIHKQNNFDANIVQRK